MLTMTMPYNFCAIVGIGLLVYIYGNIIMTRDIVHGLHDVNTYLILLQAFQVWSPLQIVAFVPSPTVPALKRLQPMNAEFVDAQRYGKVRHWTLVLEERLH